MLKRDELLKTAKPILFNTEMVKAILDGRKTVTRRVVKPQPPDDAVMTFCNGMEVAVDKKATLWNGREMNYEPKFLPYRILTGKGDTLYVRETWTTYPHGADKLAIANGTMPVYYKANYDEKELDDLFGSVWKPSIHMPKEASRIFLRITNARCERLQDITEEQAIKEGITSECRNCKYKPTDCCDCANQNEPLKEFYDLWDTTVKKQDIDIYGSNANPWVWVYEFEVLQVD